MGLLKKECVVFSFITLITVVVESQTFSPKCHPSFLCFLLKLVSLLLFWIAVSPSAQFDHFWCVKMPSRGLSCLPPEFHMSKCPSVVWEQPASALHCRALCRDWPICSSAAPVCCPEGHPSPLSPLSLCSRKCKAAKGPLSSPRAQPHRAPPHHPSSTALHFSRVRIPFLFSLLPLETSLTSFSAGVEVLYTGLSPTALVWRPVLLFLSVPSVLLTDNLQAWFFSAHPTPHSNICTPGPHVWRGAEQASSEWRLLGTDHFDWQPTQESLKKA